MRDGVCVGGCHGERTCTHVHMLACMMVEHTSRGFLLFDLRAAFFASTPLRGALGVILSLVEDGNLCS